MIKNGVYAAGLSVLNKDLSVNIDATINHAENLIKNGLHGVFFYGSTGMSQLVGLEDKKKLISKKTKAIIPVHMLGVTCKMDEIKKIAKKKKRR